LSEGLTLRASGIASPTMKRNIGKTVSAAVQPSHAAGRRKLNAEGPDVFTVIMRKTAMPRSRSIERIRFELGFGTGFENKSGSVSV
jgi:sarcosine oxidase gamma subunit